MIGAEGRAGWASILRNLGRVPSVAAWDNRVPETETLPAHPGPVKGGIATATETPRVQENPANGALSQEEFHG